jgi:hypothetical protein
VSLPALELALVGLNGKDVPDMLRHTESAVENLIIDLVPVSTWVDGSTVVRKI